jgi:dTDP-4-dehydrorhamnose reductase
VLSQKGKEVNGFAQALYTGFTTIEMAKILEKLINEFPAMHGVWQVSADEINKYDLLCMLNQLFNLDMQIKKDENFVCDRRLDSGRFRKFTGYTPPSWEHMLTELRDYNYKV